MKFSLLSLSFFLIMLKVSFAQPLYNDIIAYYPFDLASESFYGDGLKDRINGGWARIYGVSYEHDRFGNPNSACRFNGKTWDNTISDTIIIVNDGRFTLQNDSSFSISFWIDKFTETTELIRWGNFNLHQFANGQVTLGGNFLFATYNYENGYDGNTGREIWDHYAITYDKGEWEVVVNGGWVTRSSERFVHRIEGSEQNIYLGINGSNVMDDFIFFNRKLSREEILLLRDKDIFSFASDPLVLKMEFNGNLQDDVCRCSPRDSTGTLVEDRFGNPQSAYLTSSDFEPLVFRFRSDFELEYDSSLSISLWFKTRAGDKNQARGWEWQTDVLIAQGSVKKQDCYTMLYAAVLPGVNASIDVGGRVDRCLDPFNQGMIDSPNDRGGIAYENYPKDKWNHLVFTYDGSIWRMYLNNDVIGSVPAIDKESYDWFKEYIINYNVVIGAAYDSLYIDDIYYYKKVLSLAEIDALYTASDVVTGKQYQYLAVSRSEKLIGIEVYDFYGRLLYSEINPELASLEELKKRYSGLFRLRYPSRVEVERSVCLGE